MFKTIPKKRLLLYILLLGFIPIILLLFSLFSSFKHIHNLRKELSSLEENFLWKKTKQAINASVEQHYKHAEKSYIDQKLETLSFFGTSKKIPSSHHG